MHYIDMQDNMQYHKNNFPTLINKSISLFWNIFI